MARDRNLPVHTHLLESKGEEEAVRRATGMGQMEFMEDHGVLDIDLRIAHGVWLGEKELTRLGGRELKVTHCPSANLKLGSGIAPIPDYLEKGITVSLGADGAPCNNNLNIFQEMRLAALIQKPVLGPQAMPAEQVFKMATINGAVTLGLENQVGSIEPGKKADLTFIKNNQVHAIPFDNVYSKLVYSTQASDVDHVMVNGKWVLKDRILQTIDQQKTVSSVNQVIRQFL